MTQIIFGAFQNTKVTFNGQQVASGQTITLTRPALARASRQTGWASCPPGQLSCTR